MILGFADLFVEFLFRPPVAIGTSLVIGALSAVGLIAVGLPPAGSIAFGFAHQCLWPHTLDAAIERDPAPARRLEVIAGVLESRLLDGGAEELHFYTLNLAKPTNAVLSRLA